MQEFYDWVGQRIRDCKIKVNVIFSVRHKQPIYEYERVSLTFHSVLVCMDLC